MLWRHQMAQLFLPIKMMLLLPLLVGSQLRGLFGRRQRLAGKYLVDPQVTVNLVQTVSQVMTVDGQVASPGQFPVVGRMTLMRAVAVAGGTKDYADLQDVVVFREVGGQKYAALYNLEAIRRGNYADPEIYANDVIIVGDDNAKRVFRDLLQNAPLLTTPLIVLLQNL